MKLEVISRASVLKNMNLIDCVTDACQLLEKEKL